MSHYNPSQKIHPSIVNILLVIIFLLIIKFYFVIALLDIIL